MNIKQQFITYTLITSLFIEIAIIDTHWVNEVHDPHENHLSVESNFTITPATSGSRC